MSYLEATQSRGTDSTNYEKTLAAEMEAAYRTGAHKLDGLVAALNSGGVRPPSGADWTPDLLAAELARLGSVTDSPDWLLPANAAGQLPSFTTADDVITHGL